MDTESNHNKILSVLGLSRKMPRLNISGFRTYMPPDYEGSELEARDAVHRMSEIVLLHEATGLRLSYLVTESYDGETAEYSLLRIEVITDGGKSHGVMDVDFEKQVVITENGQLPFADLSRKIR